MEIERSNTEDISKYYELLNHEKETEIRIFDPAKSFFVKNKEDFIKTVTDLSDSGKDVYCGLNERKIGGKSDDEVKKFGAIFIDFDVHSDADDEKEVEKNVHLLNNKFAENNIKASLAFSGRGYHMIVPFKALEITTSNKETIRKKIVAFREFLVTKFGVDSKTFNLSRVTRVIGTYNNLAGKLSYWMDYKGYDDNFEFIDFIDAVYKQYKKEQSSKTIDVAGIKTNENIESGRKCEFFNNIAIKDKLPEGERHTTLIKNLAVYTNFTGDFKLRKKFLKKQGMDAQEFVGWDEKFKDGSNKVFNCGEIMNYCKNNGLKDVCSLCPYNNFRYNAKTNKNSKSTVKADFEVKKLLYQHGVVVAGLHNTQKKEYMYNLFEIKFLEGNFSSFVFTKNSSDYRQGDNKDFLIPLKNNKELYSIFKHNPPSEHILDKIMMTQGYKQVKIDKLRKKLEEDDKTLFKYMLDLDAKNTNCLFYTKGFGIDESDVRSLSNEDMKKIVEDYVSLGLDVDNKVKMAFESDFFIPDLAIVDMKKYQYYNNHKFLFTGTKAGKSTISSRMGHNAIRTTVKNLLGFSTSDEINRGTLHSNTRPYYLDEIQEDESKVMYGKLLSFMEAGTVNVDVGKTSITCSGLSALTFLGNPKDELNSDTTTNELKIVSQFDSTLNLITNNYSALGSRIALSVFDPNTKKLSGNSSFDEDELNDLEAKFDYLRYVSSKPFSLILKNHDVQDFLNTEFDDKYSNMLSDLASHTEMKSFKEFLEGNIFSYRHANGMALRLACLDYLNDIINMDIDYEKLVESAKVYLETIKSLNLASFKEMVDGKKTGSVISKYIKEVFNDESKALKCFIYACYKYIRDNPNERSIPMVSLEDYIVNDNEYRPNNRGSPDIFYNAVSHKTGLNHRYQIDIVEIDNKKIVLIDGLKTLKIIFGDFDEQNIYSTSNSK